MADIGVVMEKLQGFETADDIADYFQSYGIVAEPLSARACAITKFIEIETGEFGMIITTREAVEFESLHDEGWKSVHSEFTHTPAMKNFVKAFDDGDYPDLVIEGCEFSQKSWLLLSYG